jgi:hypothetical protein
VISRWLMGPESYEGVWAIVHGGGFDPPWRATEMVLSSGGEPKR